MGRLPNKGFLDGTPGVLLSSSGSNIPEMTGQKLGSSSFRIQMIESASPGFKLCLTDLNTLDISNIEFSENLDRQIKAALEHLHHRTGRQFGAEVDSLFLTVSRSASNTNLLGDVEVPFIGLSDQTLPGLCALFDDPTHVYGAYCRLILAYARVVIGTSYCRSKATARNIFDRMENRLHQLKVRKGYTQNSDLTASDWANLAGTFKAMIQVSCGSAFPEDPWTQLKTILQAETQHAFAESASIKVNPTQPHHPELIIQARVIHLE